MFEEIIAYRCKRCGKQYDVHPGVCTCEAKNHPGKHVGAFILLEQINGRWKVQCKVCNMIKEVHSSNLKRQKTCGCAPRGIDVIHIQDDNITYRCKCTELVHDKLPLDEWHCE